MCQHPYSRANSSSASQDIPHNLQSTKIHNYLLHSLPLLLLLSQINQDHTLSSHLFKVLFKIALYVLQYKWHHINHKVTPVKATVLCFVL